MLKVTSGVLREVGVWCGLRVAAVGCLEPGFPPCVSVSDWGLNVLVLMGWFDSTASPETVGW